MILLSIGAIVLVGALLYGSYTDGERQKELLEELRQLRQHNSKLRVEQVAQDSRVTNLTEILTKQDQKTEATFKAMKSGFDIMEVRQRTLEKKIIASERTVNLVFNGKVPVEHSNEPIIKVKHQPKGRGKSALIPETV